MGKHYLWAGFCLFLSSLAGINSPAAANAPPPLSVYGRLPGIEMVAISPSGDHVALIGYDGKERRLIVVDKNMKLVLTDKIGAIKARGLYWAGDSFVLLEYSTTAKLGADFLASKAELASVLVVPLDRAKPWPVFANDQSITGGVDGFDGVIQKAGKWYGYFGGITYTRSYGPGGGYLTTTNPDLYEVDLQTDRDRRIAQAVEGQHDYRNWVVGPDGTISAALDYYSRGSWIIRNAAGHRIAEGTNPLGEVGLVGLGPVPGTVIYETKDKDSGKTHFYQQPLAGGEAKQIFKGVLIHDAIFDRRSRTLAGYEVEGDRPSYKLFDPFQQRVINATQKAFPGLAMHLIDWDDKFDRLIVMTEGNGDPQTWWLVNIHTGKADQIGVSYTIPSKSVAPTRMIHYKAADGLDIAAVLTLPPGRAAKNLPVVVFPHGGPADRDYPGFDWWAQAFASRGYAVLQPNFRGSTGYGDAFEHAGDGEWGRKMQTDISDGLTELVRKGIANPKRACIMGGSYGGYAALAGVTLQHGIYRCAVAVAGISNLRKFVSRKLADQDHDVTLWRALKAEIGSGHDLSEVSPIRYASSVDVPVLLIHGKDDTVVPYDQSADMEHALRAAGKTVELVTLPGEDHWLSKSATRLEMLKAAVSFVEKYNPPSETDRKR